MEQGARTLEVWQEVRSEPEGMGAERKLVPSHVASRGLFLLSGCLGWPCPSPARRFLFGTRWSEEWAGAWPSLAGGPRTPVVCPRLL